MDYIQELQPGDKVIGRLGRNQRKYLQRIYDQSDRVTILQLKLAREKDKLQALQIMFWDHLLSQNERCETAFLRNKTLIICRDEYGKPVIVERPRAASE